MTSQEYQEKINEYKKKRTKLFTDDIRNSNTYNRLCIQYNFQDENEQALYEAVKTFDSLLCDANLNDKDDFSRNTHLLLIKKQFELIKLKIKKIDWK